MNFQKTKKFSKVAFVIFNFLVLLTMFVPSLSLDRYVEYDFNYGYFNEAYQGYTEPIASNITPVMIISSIFSDRIELGLAKKDYLNYKNKLLTKLEAGEITEDQYTKELAEAKTTNRYITLAMYYGAEDELSRFQSKMFLYAIVLLIFYSICGLLLILNLINLANPKKLLSIANVFVGWVQTVIILIFNLYTFSLALSFVKNIEGFQGNIVEETMVCMGPKFLTIFLVFAFLAYAIVAMILERMDNKFEKHQKEIPEAVSKTLQTQNRFRKINSKKSKYKHGSKKKRHR